MLSLCVREIEINSNLVSEEGTIQTKIIQGGIFEVYSDTVNFVISSPRFGYFVSCSVYELN